MKNKICIVTGANSGIGKETTKQLVELGAHVVMVVRNEEKGQAALNEIKEKTGKDTLDLMLCDFASQQSIREFAPKFKEKYDKLDVLVNNHGVVLPKKHFTEDGIESTFAINHLGYFLLTNLLLDLLKASAPSRIVNVSSGGYAAVRKWHLEDYNFETRKYTGFRAYTESKLYNIMFTYDLAERLAESKVTVNSYNPSFTRTNLGRHIEGLMKILSAPGYLFARSAKKATKTAIYLAASPEVEGVTGKYFLDCKIRKTSPMSYNKQLQKELWDLCEKLTKK